MEHSPLAAVQVQATLGSLQLNGVSGSMAAQGTMPGSTRTQGVEGGAMEGLRLDADKGQEKGEKCEANGKREGKGVAAALSSRTEPIMKQGESGGAESSPDGSGGSGSSSSSRMARSSYWREKLEMVTNMIYFASEGDELAMKQLLAEGGDPNSTDYDGRSALHLAASEGHLEVVRLLVEKGARVNPRDRWGNTPLTDAQRALAEHKIGNYDFIIQFLKSKGGMEGSLQMGDDWEIDVKELEFVKSKLIGKGAFGEIRRCPWRGTPVAVKTILPSLSKDPQIVKEFRDEVFLLVKLRHPNVVQFLGCVTRAQPMCLVTEYLPGGDLHDVMKARGGPLPARTAVAYGLDIARGMNYLHNHKPEAIIHRDLKPRNLLRDGGDHMKVADFGLSKLVKVNTLREMYKMTGETGSYRYMAPEVFKHEAYDRSVDVYSFGVILYEMFEGLPPFAKTLTAEGVAWKVAMEGVRPPFKAKNYPPGVKELISACWSEVPMQRPSFMAIIEKLEEIEKLLKKEAAAAATTGQLQ